MAFDANDEADQKVLKEAIDAAVAGLKANNEDLKAEKTKLKQKLDALSESVEGLDIPKVKEMLKKFGNDQEATLIAEGKVDEVVNLRTERMRKEHQKELDALQVKVKTAEGFVSKFRERALSDSLREAALTAGCTPTAVEDIVLRGSRVFQLDDDGNPVALKDGEPVYGKDGSKKLTPAEWAESLRETAPHLWPEASGGGAGSNGGGGTAKPFKDMSESERKELFLKDPKEYERRRDAGKAKHK